MKFLLLIFNFQFLVFNLFSQDPKYNLVNNYSFEDTVKCPSWNSQLERAKGWIDPLENVPGFAGTDYFNACSNIVNVPHALSFGYQNAKTGIAYAGLYTYHNGDDEREYAETNLFDILKANKNYFISFYVSLSDVVYYAINSIGAHISDTLIFKTTDMKHFNLTPQISNPKTRFLSDTAGWTKVSGIYKAKGGERYITIGNFKSDKLTDTLSIPHISKFPAS